MINKKASKRWQISLQVSPLCCAVVDLRSGSEYVFIVTKTENTIDKKLVLIEINVVTIEVLTENALRGICK
jgi:hypothetical protein